MARKVLINETKEITQKRAARGESQEERQLALPDGTAFHLNLFSHGFPLGPCGIRGGCNHPDQELRPSRRRVYCQTVVHLFCAGEPKMMEKSLVIVKINK
jgi:hypothetical protein